MNTAILEKSIPALNVKSLESFVAKLVNLETSASPLISCYVDLTKPREVQIAEIQHRGAIARSGLRGQARYDFDDAFQEIIDYLRQRPMGSRKSLAIFSRWGDEPFLAPMEFEMPMEDQVSVDSLPMIYPLVALKDKLHRFVVVLTSEAEARILEVVIGQVTESILAKRPELRKRVGREWTKQHFQSHKRNRHTQFIKEKVATIESLMAKKGYNHLIIMGSAPNVTRLTNALPKGIQEKVIEPNGGAIGHDVSDVVAEAVKLFIDAEEAESHSTVDQLHEGIMTNGLAVAGHDQVLRALLTRQADTLVILDSYPLEQREELVRAAVQAKVNIETVGESEMLDHYGGAGCLLRYRTPSLFEHHS